LPRQTAAKLAEEPMLFATDHDNIRKLPQQAADNVRNLGQNGLISRAIPAGS